MIEISSKALNYLKSLAEPFVDTPESVIDRIIEEHAQVRASINGKPSNGLAISSTSKNTFSFESLPQMYFTKIEKVEMDGRIVNVNTWNGLVEEVIRTCVTKGYDSEEVRRKLRANTVAGRNEDLGFRHVTQAGFSFQGLDAMRACEAALGLARDCGVPLTVHFIWRQNAKAFRPGVRAAVSNT
jgi:hypothetical protein